MFRYILSYLVLVLFLHGCGPSKHRLSIPAPSMPAAISNNASLPVGLPYHIVCKGETLWRICTNYGVPIDEVTRINKIKNPSDIKVGQKIFLPIKEGLPNEKYHFSDRYSGKTEQRFMWPVKGKVVMFFGQTRDGWVNKGINIVSHRNYVCAPKTGKVVFLETNMRGYGTTMIIDHGDNFLSVLSAQARPLCSLGDVVRQGQKVLAFNHGKGRLHFEIRKRAKPVNPLEYLR